MIVVLVDEAVMVAVDFQHQTPYDWDCAGGVLSLSREKLVSQTEPTVPPLTMVEILEDEGVDKACRQAFKL